MKNLGSLMKNFDAIQSRLVEFQDKMQAAIVTGQSGGGLVKVTLTGKGAMTAVKIDPTLLKPDEQEIIEDLIVAAHSDAKNRLEALLTEDLNAGLPPGVKLPF